MTDLSDFTLTVEEAAAASQAYFEVYRKYGISWKSAFTTAVQAVGKMRQKGQTAHTCGTCRWWQHPTNVVWRTTNENVGDCTILLPTIDAARVPTERIYSCVLHTPIVSDEGDKS